MIKLVFCLHRLPGLSREAFQRTWLEEHGPLVRAHAEALGIVRYVQSHTGFDSWNQGLRASRGGPEAYDGVAELWWPDRAAFERALASEAGRRAGAALLEDEKRFIDLTRSPLWLCEEHEVVQKSGSSSGA